MPDKYPINIFNTHTRLTQYLIAICTHYHPTGPKIFLPDPKLKIPVRPWLPVMLGRRWRAQRNLEAQLGGTSVWRRRCLEGARLQTQQRNEISYLIVKHNMQTLNPVLFCLPEIKRHWLLLRGRALSLPIPPNLQVMILSREIIWWSETPNLWLHHTTAAGWVTIQYYTACCALQSALSVLGQQLSAIDWG